MKTKSSISSIRRRDAAFYRDIGWNLLTRSRDIYKRRYVGLCRRYTTSGTFLIRQRHGGMSVERVSWYRLRMKMAGIMQIGGREQFHKYCPLVLKGENDLPCVKKYNTFMFWVPLLNGKTIMIDILDRMCGLRLPVKWCQGALYREGISKMLYRWKNHQYRVWEKGTYIIHKLHKDQHSWENWWLSKEREKPRPTIVVRGYIK